MKKEDLPQDQSSLVKMTRELCYVKDSNGKYSANLSTGWEVKTSALENTWEAIHSRIESAKLAVKNGKKSPLYYFLELRLMNLSILSDYTGYWKFSIRKHLKPATFKKLSEKKLSIYAKALDLSIEELKNFKG